jgi:hypothetical protein
VWRASGWAGITGYCAGLVGIVFAIALLLVKAAAKAQLAVA